ncbi:MAG: amino acid adenylation domain-containing protein, partial [Gemmatimonadaceae bacterium]
MFHSLAFDFSVWELWGALTTGGRAVVVSWETARTPARFAALVAEAGVTVLNQTPSAFQQVLPYLAAGTERDVLRHVIFGGEALEPGALAPWFASRSRGAQLTNMYGITETTVHVTYRPVTEADTASGGGGSAIGERIRDLQTYVLDAGGEPVPIGVAGELYVGGAGVARGYWQRPGLTAERFVPDPFGAAGSRLYRTGDRVRWTRRLASGNPSASASAGELEYLGRLDAQVKVRGYRIEPGEIEAVLAAHPAVSQALVMTWPDDAGQRQLVAYCVPSDGTSPNVDELQAYLAERLPSYMVPAAYVLLAAVPLTSNGKVDRKALPAPDRGAYKRGEYAAPVGAVETTLAELWTELLHVDRVSRYDDFFALGGHSLIAVRLVTRIRQVLGSELGVADLFRVPVLADLARVLGDMGPASAAPIVPIPRDAGTGAPVDPPPLSFAQQRLWFLEQLGGIGPAYHLGWETRLSAAIDRDALIRALDAVVARHESLRTTFVVGADGAAVQHIAPASESRFALVEHVFDGPDARRRLRELADEELRAPFDLQRGPLIRGRIVRLDLDLSFPAQVGGDAASSAAAGGHRPNRQRVEHVLLVTMHHIVSDGWSMEVLVEEVQRLYDAFRNGKPDQLPPLAVQYADYTVWQRAHLTGAVLAEQSDYWRATLAGAAEVLELPIDRPRPAERDYRGAVVPVELDADLTAQLQALSRQHGVTLFHTLLAGWGIVLARLVGRRDVVIGTALANRGRAEVEDLIGFFVNALPLRIEAGGAMSTSELLAQVKARTLAAQAHEDLPFEQIVELVQARRSLSHSPVFQVMFTWQNASRGRRPKSVPEGARVAPPSPVGHTTAKFDLELGLEEIGGSIVGRIEYATALWDEATVARFAEYLRLALGAMAADASRPVDSLDILPSAERQRFLVDCNRTESAYAADRGVHHLFAEQAAATPNAVAVTAGDVRWSYAELDARANQLARYLRELGVVPEVRVAVFARRTPDLVVSILAVMKAGGAYVPLDAAYPMHRLQQVLDDARPGVVLTEGALAGALPTTFAYVCSVDEDWPMIEGDSDDARAYVPPPIVSPAQTAYVLYTSGSTGRPKGVVVTHGGLTNYASWAASAYEVSTQGAPVHSSIAFDLTVTSLFLPLVRGGAVTLVPDDGALDSLAALLTTKPGFDFIKITPGHLQALAGLLEPAAAASAARAFVIGGEALTGAHLGWWRAHAPASRFVNEYGPTETVVGCCVHDVAPGEIVSDPIAIGRPIANARAYVLSSALEPVPQGTIAELWIGGHGVARGYLDRPALTAERFVPDPFGPPGGRLYRSGDLARWRSDGVLDFLGRTDDQVKVRGYRIELGEIEAAVANHAGIAAAAVIARDDAVAGQPSDRRLVAYFVDAVADSPVEADVLRHYLEERLPAYMVPAVYVRLAAFPLTANGKTDRAALPAPGQAAYSHAAYEAPLGPIETVLAELWCELLRVPRVGRDDDFFALGGHSLLGVTLIERMRQRGLSADLRTLFVSPTLAALAASIGEHTEIVVPPNGIPAGCTAITPDMLPLVRLSQAELDAAVATVPGGAENVQDIYPLAPLQEGMLFHHLAAVGGDPYLGFALVEFTTRDELEAYVHAFAAVIDRHDILRTAIVWDGLTEPLQVVWRRVALSVDEVTIDVTAGDVADELRRRFDPRTTRIDIQRAPLVRAYAVCDPRRHDG